MALSLGRRVEAMPGDRSKAESGIRQSGRLPRSAQAAVRCRPRATGLSLEIKDGESGHVRSLITRLLAVKLANLSNLARSCDFKRLESRDH